MKRINRKTGDILEIELGNGSYAYSHVLYDPLFAFYDSSESRVSDLEKIIKLPVLWRIWVSKHAVTSGRWKIIGNVSPEEELMSRPDFFKQDALSGELSIYNGVSERTATRKECESIERAAVWDPEHVEDRLRDFYSGVENKWVKSLGLK